MTREQQIEAEKVKSLLEQCRERLDNARFRMGPVSNEDPQFQACCRAYNCICRALDEF